jgi:hypothetical protein
MTRIAAAALAASLFLSACGGSDGGTEPTIPEPQPTTGQVALLFTDKPTDEFSAIKFNVIEAILIGGEGVDGQQHFLFKGEEPIDLLNLTNFSEPVVFGEVDAGIYTKLRVVIDALELVPLDGGPSIFPPLPANGKIDLLDPNGIEVLPGRTLIAEIDMDANKAIHVVGAGRSGQYRFRPVVKATFMDGDLGELPDKLARLEGTVRTIFSDPAGGFELCDIETPDSCVDVATNDGTSIFGADGTSTPFSTLMPNDTVVVIGNYTVDDGILLHAVVLEIGGNAEQVQGNVVSDPADNQFLLLTNPDAEDAEARVEMVVQLQDATKYYDENGALGPEAIVLGTDVEVEGVVESGTPDLIRAALVFIEAEDDEQLSGTIAEPLNAAADGMPANFVLVFEDTSTTCVNVYENTDVLLVDVAASEVTMGDFTNLAKDQVVDVFGQSSLEPDGCFEANEVIVDVNASPST